MVVPPGGGGGWSLLEEEEVVVPSPQRLPAGVSAVECSVLAPAPGAMPGDLAHGDLCPLSGMRRRLWVWGGVREGERGPRSWLPEAVNVVAAEERTGAGETRPVGWEAPD